MEVNEVYKPIIGYEGLYEISNLYNVKSLAKRIQRGKYNAWRNCPEKILSVVNGDVTLCKNGKRKTNNVYTLFKIAFEGFKPDGKRKINLINNNGKILEVKRRQFCQIIKSKNKNKSSKHVGVSKRNGKFRSQICINNKDIYLGTFINENEALNMYLLSVKNTDLYKGNARDFRVILKSFFC